MGKVDNTRRILADDFDKDMREFVSKFGEIYNFTIENITNAINGQLNYDNLRKTLVEIAITVDANGIPLLGGNFVSEADMVGSTILRAINLTTVTNYVDSAPFMTYSRIQGEQYKVEHIAGLRSGENYQLLIELTPLS